MADRDPQKWESMKPEEYVRQLEKQVEQSGVAFGHGGGGVSLKTRAAFLESVLAFEQADTSVLRDDLERAGVHLPAPSEMDDRELHVKLWQVIHALAERQTYLSSTDHLSDRELYTHLVDDLLLEPTEILGVGWNNHLDLLGSGSDEDIALQMKFYADEQERASWLKDFPDFEMPEQETAPFERDHLLPAPCYES